MCLCLFICLLAWVFCVCSVVLFLIPGSWEGQAGKLCEHGESGA